MLSEWTLFLNTFPSREAPGPSSSSSPSEDDQWPRNPNISPVVGVSKCLSIWSFRKSTKNCSNSQKLLASSLYININVNININININIKIKDIKDYIFLMCLQLYQLLFFTISCNSSVYNNHLKNMFLRDSYRTTAACWEMYESLFFGHLGLKLERTS